MTLASGTRLGPYEIVAPIGAGGMGEVYKARDTRLERDVALKVLPAAVALDPERLRRFEQEARATAALNHPNLLAVFDVGAEAGVNYLVSELLEGETVRDRLKTGPVPLRKSIEYAAQIARGLSAAHDKGIVHRDLKPENVFVTREGRIKILDFGIAKLMGPRGGQTIAATVERGTTPGMVLGTIGYMSPEQVRGLDADHRADIFSFGAILYELLSGRRAFTGATEADTMSAILTADPPEIGDATRVAPPILDRLVRRCLEKNPDERFQSARDLAFDLEAISTTSHAGSGVGAVIAPAVPTARARPLLAWVAAALAVGLALGAAATWAALSRARVGAPAQFSQVSFRRGTIVGARLSADGETIVYSAGWEGRPQELYTTRVGAVGERPLGIAGELLAVSKNGEMALLKDVRILANWMQTGTLARAPLAGGAPREILRDVGGADWSPDGQSLAVTRFLPERRRWQLEYPPGTVVYTTDRWIERPRISRDGTKVLLLEHPISGDNRGRVILVTQGGKKADWTSEYPSVIGLAWAPDDTAAWFTASTGGVRLELLAARPNEPIRRVMPGPASLVVEDILANGRMLVQTNSTKVRILVKTPNDAKERDISWFDYGLLRDMSADGSTLLFEEEGEGGGPNYSVFIRRTDGSPAVRLGDGYAGRLSPDLQWATTVSTQGPPNVITMVPVGPGEPRKLTIPLEVVGVTIWRWFPDGKRLVILGNEPGHQRRSFEYAIDTGKLRPLTPEGTTGTLVSPDGRALAVTAPDGKQLIWPIDGAAPREIPGLTPQDVALRWAADGRSIFIGTPSSTTTRTISRVDLADGRRQVMATIAPTDAAGVRALAMPFISADGGTYAYRYSQILSDLFVASGVR
jgi:hypothetical protein